MRNPFSQAPSGDSRLDAILVEYLQAVESGNAPDRQAFIARHPEFAAELTEFLTNQAFLAQVAPPRVQPEDRDVGPTIARSPPLKNGSEAAPNSGTEAGANLPAPTRVRYFGDYELLEEIARGGMGVVYKARQVNLKRVVALKMILAGQLATEADVQRFYSEAEAAARLDHPGIVPIFEVGKHEGLHYFSMAYVEGESLTRKLGRGVFRPREAAELARKVALAIAYAHVAGVVHRDLKPANILLDKEGEPRVTDFGLAKQVGAGEGPTISGQVLGTPSYMPPEQAAGDRERMGPLSDIYSLGALLYCLLTGRPPFQAATAVETLLQVMEREPASLRQLNAAVPRDLETICLKCLEKEPARRYASAQELADELQRFLDGRPILAQPISAPARAVRWCRRNPLVASLTAAVAASLLVGTGISLYWAGLAMENARAADTNAGRARQQQALAEEHAGKADAAATKALAEKGRADANAVAAEASASRARAETLRALRHLYAAQMNQANDAWNNADISRLNGLLTNQRPALAQIFDPFTAAKLNKLPGEKWAPGDTERLKELLAAKHLNRPQDFDPRGWEWHYWNRTVNSHLGQLPFPADKPSSLDQLIITADGSRLIGSYDTLNYSQIYIWDARTKQLLTTTMLPPSRGTMLVFSGDGSRAATVFRVNFSHGKDTKFNAVIRDVATGDVVRTFEGVGPVAQAALDAEGRRLIVAEPVAKGYGPQRVTIWSTDSEVPPLELKGEIEVEGTFNGIPVKGKFPHGGHVNAIAFSPNGERVATASSDGTTRIWNVASGERIWNFDDKSGSILALCFSPDSRLVATCAKDKVAMWDTTSGARLHALHVQAGSVYCGAFSPDGKLLATGGSDHILRVWDTTSGALKNSIKGHAGYLRHIVFSGPQEMVALDSYYAAKIWDAERDQNSQTFQFSGISGWKLALAFATDSQRLSAGGPRVETWDLTTGERVARLERRGKGGRPWSISPDGSHWAWEDLRNEPGQRTILVLSATTGEVAHTIKTGHTDYLSATALSPDRRFLATAAQDRTLEVWSLDPVKRVAQLPGFRGGLQQLLFTPDGGTLIAAGQSPEVRVWQTESWTEKKLEGRFQWNVSHVAVSRDGTRLAAVSSQTHHVRLWDLTTGELLDMIHTGLAVSCAFHPDGTRLATAHEGDGVRVWDVSTGQALLAFTDESLSFNQVAFSPDGARLAAAAADGTIKVWNASPMPDDPRLPPLEDNPSTGVIKTIEVKKLTPRTPLGPETKPASKE